MKLLCFHTCFRQQLCLNSTGCSHIVNIIMQCLISLIRELGYLCNQRSTFFFHCYVYHFTPLNAYVFSFIIRFKRSTTDYSRIFHVVLSVFDKLYQETLTSAAVYKCFLNLSTIEMYLLKCVQKFQYIYFFERKVSKCYKN